MGTSAFAPSRSMVVEIGCEDLLQKPLTRSTLRIVLDRVKTVPTTSSAVSALQNSSPPLAGRHLLYAEDSLPSQKIVTRMLVNAGARCSVAENGAAAVEAALNNPSMFDCILMDCNMPIMDGWEATQEIQKVLGHTVPIIAVTANAMKGDREKCLEAGMDDYVTKPVKRSLLIGVVLRWINFSRSKQDAEEYVQATANDAGDEAPSDGVLHKVRTWSSFHISDSAKDKETASSLWALEPSGVNMSAGWASEPICDYCMLLQITGHDDKFVVALLGNFKDSLSVFSDSLAEQPQRSRLFDAQSLHGAAVSMCTPRVVAAISDFIVATTMGCYAQNDDGAVTGDVADSGAPGMLGAEDSGIERAIGEVRVAVDELAHFLRAVESGVPPRCAMMQGRVGVKRRSPCTTDI